MPRVLAPFLVVLAVACRPLAPPSEETSAPSTARLERKTPNSSRAEKPTGEPYEGVKATALPAADQWKLTASYQENHKSAPTDLASLERTLRPAAREHQPRFRVENARHFDLLNERLQLSSEQRKKLIDSGFISLEVDRNRPYSMAALYLSIWQAELPVLITTDSILHAWHRSYDDSLMMFEVHEAMPGYRRFLEGMRGSLENAYPQLPSELSESAKDLDLYIAVALSLLKPAEKDDSLLGATEEPTSPSVAPLKAPRDLVDALLGAIRSERAQKIRLYGALRLVDFSQFKVRGHYTKSIDLKKYFRAAMWMGRADTGFTVVNSRGEVDLRSARTALLAAHLARHSGQHEPFSRLQKSIDYFVGAANGLSIGDVVDFLGEEGVNSPAELSSEAKVTQLAAALARRGPKDRVISQGIVSHADKVPPLAFQLASQRFTLDSFVHGQLSADQVEKRHMVTAPEVFAAFGNDEATRLLAPEIEKFAMSDEVGALRKTIADLPQAYWEQNVYTRWFDVLRTLDEIPDSPHFPELFEGLGWQRKQLQTQLASFAELRRDTILYVAQSYSSILCDFPDLYVEPYPAFFGKMERMARDASRHLNNPKFFNKFADIMARLERAARAQLDGRALAAEDRKFLYHLVKLDVTSMGCGPPEKVWTGWYQALFSDGTVDVWEPVIADVFTDPNTGQALNVATGSPELGIVSIETKKGPAIFVGPIYSYREFVGARINDEQWQQALKANTAPKAPPWVSSFQSGKNQPPKPHPQRPNDPTSRQPFY